MVQLFWRTPKRTYFSYTAWKVSKYGVFSGLYFTVFGLNTEIYEVSPNKGSYGLEKTLYLDTFHTVLFIMVNPFYSNVPFLSYKHTTCIPRCNDVETVVSKSFQLGMHVCVCKVFSFYLCKHQKISGCLEFLISIKWLHCPEMCYFKSCRKVPKASLRRVPLILVFNNKRNYNKTKQCVNSKNYTLSFFTEDNQTIAKKTKTENNKGHHWQIEKTFFWIKRFVMLYSIFFFDRSPCQLFSLLGAYIAQNT